MLLLAVKKIAANIIPADDGSFAWLFFKDGMPSASVVEVTVDGSTIKPLDGGDALDADGDGEAGGVLKFDFSTVSLAPLPNTSLSGIIADPGPDLLPFTADDFDPGADGIKHTEDDVFLLPIEGVEVFLIGLEDQKVFTDANGRYVLDSVPGGNAKLVMNGMTATGTPEGFYFPEMVTDTNIEAGVDNFAMPGMPEMYLPRIANEILKDVDVNQTTRIVADEISAPGLNSEQREFLSIEVQPNSLVSPNGEKLDSGQVGISTVPAELVRDMLPPGVLQHTFDITVQAPGISNFSTPAPMTFPNVFDAEPGS
ncbi:MAG: carboxypeptidase-like regulatory domain-containing protein, partial [Rivularia sp. ALOHA_DT_140]|nr:carboxypeptidase-like regulatory domain-containing protein [Rivularia sp. ALOHA_DT_140]